MGLQQQQQHQQQQPTAAAAALVDRGLLMTAAAVRVSQIWRQSCSSWIVLLTPSPGLPKQTKSKTSDSPTTSLPHLRTRPPLRTRARKKKKRRTRTRRELVLVRTRARRTRTSRREGVS